MRAAEGAATAPIALITPEATGKVIVTVVPSPRRLSIARVPP